MVETHTQMDTVIVVETADEDVRVKRGQVIPIVPPRLAEPSTADPPSPSPFLRGEP